MMYQDPLMPEIVERTLPGVTVMLELTNDPMFVGGGQPLGLNPRLPLQSLVWPPSALKTNDPEILVLSESVIPATTGPVDEAETSSKVHVILPALIGSAMTPEATIPAIKMFSERTVTFPPVNAYTRELSREENMSFTKTTTKRIPEKSFFGSISL